MILFREYTRIDVYSIGDKSTQKSAICGEKKIVCYKSFCPALKTSIGKGTGFMPSGIY